MGMDVDTTTIIFTKPKAGAEKGKRVELPTTSKKAEKLAASQRNISISTDRISEDSELPTSTVVDRVDLDEVQEMSVVAPPVQCTDGFMAAVRGAIVRADHITVIPEGTEDEIQQNCEDLLSILGVDRFPDVLPQICEGVFLVKSTLVYVVHDLKIFYTKLEKGRRVLKIEEGDLLTCTDADM